MADQKDYVLVRLEDNINDNAVLSYDATKDMIVDSGVHADRGALSTAAGTLNVGLQAMSSAGEQVVWRNKNSGIRYSPPWHTIDEVSAGGSKDRFYAPIKTEQRFTIDVDIIENPYFSVHIPSDELVFRLHMDFPEARDNIEFKITQNGFEMWREIKNVSSGLNSITLDTPIAFYTGDFVFSIKPYNDSDLPVKVKGNAQTGEVAYSVDLRNFTEKTLATQEFVLGNGDGAASNYMQKSVYDIDNDGVVDFSKAIKGAEQSKANSYYGTDSNSQVGFHDLPAADTTALEASIKTNTDAIARHETAINGHGAQIARNTSLIESTRTAMTTIAGEVETNARDITGVKNNLVDGLDVRLIDATKSIVFRLLVKGRVVDTDTISLAHWFTGQPPVTDEHTLYYGFTTKDTLTDSEIKAGETMTTRVLDGTSIVISRVDKVPSYMWVWVPDAAGTVQGFEFSGFVSIWKSTAVAIDTVDGKLFISPNKTAANNVSFEVKA